MGSGGSGALNIRNLNSVSGAGISRTLTLLDGARVVPTDKRGTVNVHCQAGPQRLTLPGVTGSTSNAQSPGEAAIAYDTSLLGPTGMEVVLRSKLFDYLGHSIGHWEGDTLVVDTIGFNEKMWFDSDRSPHTNQLHLVEKFTRISQERLQYDITIDRSQPIFP